MTIQSLKNLAFGIIILILSTWETSAQDTLRITTAQNEYFKPINREHVYFIQLKDSLPDGVYLVYRNTNTRSSKKCLLPFITATYVNGMRHGSYSEVEYQPFKGKCIPSLVSDVSYVNGQKHGLELRYFVLTENRGAVMLFQKEYNLGVKHGVFIEYSEGIPMITEYYENGKLIHSLYTPHHHVVPTNR
jgi:antitoxin component YwqK of YwqJK toxin-antitoxin module